jgi:hypothetical protein
MQGASMCQMEASLIIVSRLREMSVHMKKTQETEYVQQIFALLFSIQVYKILPPSQNVSLFRELS